MLQQTRSTCISKLRYLLLILLMPYFLYSQNIIETEQEPGILSIKVENLRDLNPEEKEKVKGAIEQLTENPRYKRLNVTDGKQNIAFSAGPSGKRTISMKNAINKSTNEEERTLPSEEEVIAFHSERMARLANFPLNDFFCSFLSYKKLPQNSFQIGQKEWNLTSAIIANESYGSKSKYELDLLSDSNDLAKAKTYVYFSITSPTTTSLLDGFYQFSSESLDKRAPFQFHGWVKINDQKINFTEGSFSIENQKERTNIHFILKLENGDVINGSYSGEISSVDRSQNYE